MEVHGNATWSSEGPTNTGSKQGLGVPLVLLALLAAIHRVDVAIVAGLALIEKAVAADLYLAAISAAAIARSGVAIIASLHARPRLAVAANVGFAQKCARAVVGIACT